MSKLGDEIVENNELIFNKLRKSHGLNAYQSILYLADRARQIQRGSYPLVQDNNKPTILALREVQELA